MWTLTLNGRKYRTISASHMYNIVRVNSPDKTAAAGNMRLLALLEASESGLTVDDCLAVVRAPESVPMRADFKKDRKMSAKQALAYSTHRALLEDETLEYVVGFVERYFKDPRRAKPEGDVQ